MKKAALFSWIVFLFLGICLFLMTFAGVTLLKSSNDLFVKVSAETGNGYWAMPTVCPECGDAPASDPSSGDELTFKQENYPYPCTYSYTHTGNRGGFTHSGTVSIHTPQTVPKKEPTCITAGYESYAACVYCHTLNTSYIELPATGHTWDSGTVTHTPTCQRPGTMTYECSPAERPRRKLFLH